MLVHNLSTGIRLVSFPFHLADDVTMMSVILQLYAIFVTQINFFVVFNIPSLDMRYKDQVNNCCRFAKKSSL